MNKETKKAYDLISKKENEKSAIVAKLEKELNDLISKQAALKTKIETGENATEYIKNLAELRDIETAIEYFTKKLEDAKASPVLTDAEYSKIKADAKQLFAAVKAEHAAAIQKQIETLVQLLTAFDADTVEINKLLEHAAKLQGSTSTLSLNAQSIGQEIPESKFYIEAYYKTKAAHDLLKRGLKI